MDFYLFLEKIMEDRQLSIPDISRLSGLSDSTIRSAIVRKQKHVALEVAFKLSEGLNVSLEEINGGHSVDAAQKRKAPSATTEKAFVDRYIETFGHEPSTEDIEKAILLLRAASEFNK